MHTNISYTISTSRTNEGCMVASIKEASEIVGHLLKEDKGEYPTIADMNEGRYFIQSYSDEKVMVLFKREFFKTFNIQTNSDEGYGEGINISSYNEAIKRNVKRFFFVYPDGKVYMITRAAIEATSTLRKTEAENKEMFVFPANQLIRFNPDFKTAAEVLHEQQGKEAIRSK